MNLPLAAWPYFDRAYSKLLETLGPDDSNLEDFPLVIDGSKLSDKFWANVRSDLGDVRASTDANVQIPCYVHWYNYSQKKALIFVKATILNNRKTVVRIHYGNASATTLAVTDTYGRNKCFNDDIRGYWPDGGGNDVTSYGNHFSGPSMPAPSTSPGPVGGSFTTIFNGSQYGSASASVPTNYPVTMLQYGYLANATAAHTGLSLFNSNSPLDHHVSLWNGQHGTDPFQGATRSNSVFQEDTLSTNSFAASTWTQGAYVLASATSRKAGGDGGNFDASPATTSISPVSLNRIGVGAFQHSGGNSLHCNGQLSFLQLHTVARSDKWIKHDWAMISNHDEFWGDWTPHQSIKTGGVEIVYEREADVTITHDAQAGGWASGAGFSQTVADGETWDNAISSVIWTGGRTRGEAMWLYQGQQAVYEKFNLWGASKESRTAPNVPPARVPVGLLIDKAYGGLDVGTGSLVLRDMCIEYAAIGIKGAESLFVDNCEMITLERVMFNRCEKAMQINNIQGMGWRCESPTISFCDTFLEVVAGGDFHVDNATLISPNHTFLKLLPTHLGHGTNGSKYTIREVKIDNISVNAVMLDMVEGSVYYADVVFEDLHFPSETWTNPAFYVSGHSTLHLDRVKNLQPGMICVRNANGWKPRVVLTNCSITGNVGDELDLFHASSTGDCYLVIEDCYKDNEPGLKWTDHDGSVTCP